MKQDVFDFIGFIVFDLQNFFYLAQFFFFFICSPVIRARKIIVKSSVPTLTTT